MWNGGVRVILFDEEGRILLVCQRHEGKDIWMAPGGDIEENELSRGAAVREVKEETGLDIEVGRLLWHIEQIRDDGAQRFVNFFLGRVTGGTPALGTDPEFDEEHQRLVGIRFMEPDEVRELPYVYPSFLRDEIDDIVRENAGTGAVRANDPYRIRSG